MKTEIEFVGGETRTFDVGVEVKLTELGVTISEGDGEEAVRVLFPWTRIEKVTQRGLEVKGSYSV